MGGGTSFPGPPAARGGAWRRTIRSGRRLRQTPRLASLQLVPGSRRCPGAMTLGRWFSEGERGLMNSESRGGWVGAACSGSALRGVVCSRRPVGGVASAPPWSSGACQLSGWTKVCPGEGRPRPRAASAVVSGLRPAGPLGPAAPEDDVPLPAPPVGGCSWRRHLPLTPTPFRPRRPGDCPGGRAEGVPARRGHEQSGEGRAASPGHCRLAPC